MHPPFSFSDALPARRVAPARRHAFTLIELLTVIAIIGILAAILVPVVGSARQSAKQSRTVSNLRQIGVAVNSFTLDNRGHFPRSSHGYGQAFNSWINTLRPYLGENDAVRACALDPRADLIIREKLSSFTLNEWLLPSSSAFADPSSRFTTIGRVSSPATTFLAFVNREAKETPDISDDHTHSTSWGNWGAVVADIDPDRFRRSGPRSADRTTGSSPYLFVDSHVEVITAASLQARLAAAVGEGRKLSQPVR